MTRTTTSPEPGPNPPCSVSIRDAVATVTLTRPDIHNAFDETLIARLTETFVDLDDDSAVRAVVLAGEGRSFCAGADLNWMKRMAAYGPDENLADANALAAMLRALYALSKPTIARVHGAAYGGGVGLVAACDIAIGARQARRYFLTAERFDAATAHSIGLLHEVVPAPELDARIDEMLRSLRAAGPNAQLECKALIRGVAHRPIDADVITGTARHIAAVRASDEGREGVAAFLGKRPPAWVRTPGKA